MSAADATDGQCIDVRQPTVRLALSALDVELNQLHRLCTEQGLFFKAFFHEAASDALRQGL